MTATKKSMRFLTALALIFAMVLSISSVPVSAAVGGPETWYTGSSTSPTLNINGYNTTYAKTIANSGTLTVSAHFTPADQLTNYSFTLEICNAAGNTIVGTFTDSLLTSKTLTVRTNVTAGQVIFIRMGSFKKGTNVSEPSAVYYSRTLS